VKSLLQVGSAAPIACMRAWGCMARRLSQRMATCGNNGTKGARVRLHVCVRVRGLSRDPGPIEI
jgi:hypothetical protein